MGIRSVVCRTEQRADWVLTFAVEQKDIKLWLVIDNALRQTLMHARQRVRGHAT